MPGGSDPHRSHGHDRWRSIGVERYRVPSDWFAAIDLAADGPRRLVDAIHDAEASDPLGERWPRSKRHDDKAVAVLRFDRAT